MDISDYQKHVLRTWNPAVTGDDAVTASVFGAIGELGELVELLKKARYHGHVLDQDKVQKELSDCVYYWAALCHHLGFDAGAIAELNIEKLRARYPNGFEVEKSLHRAPGDR